MTDEPIRTGVIGVGSMGRHHARVYSELPNVELVGIYDVDADRAREVADRIETRVRSFDGLLADVDAVSVVVPTEHHYETAMQCLGEDVHVLVEKPFVDNPERGEELLRRASDDGLVLQVGHIERFNPAVLALENVVSDLDIIGLQARRLGPPLDRDVSDTVTRDLMIHDVDILLSLVQSDVASMSAHACEGSYSTATFQFDDGTIGTLTASRVTERKVRELTISARSCHVVVDYIDQSIDIHRNSFPEFVERGNEIRYRHESIVERPMVENTEPLRNELASFVAAVADEHPPRVTGEEALRALKWVSRIETEGGSRIEAESGSRIETESSKS